jgi:hypothetical protein
MRVIIKGADFSEVSIGKVVKDLSFEVSANKIKGVSGFTNWNEESQIVVSEPIYRISGETVYYGNKSLRLHTDFIEVVGGMTVTAKAFSANVGNNEIIPNIVCFNKDKQLFTDASDSTHVLYFDLSSHDVETINFTIPEDVKYIIIQSGATDYTTIENVNVYTGSMPI